MPLGREKVKLDMFWKKWMDLMRPRRAVVVVVVSMVSWDEVCVSCHVYFDIWVVGCLVG